MFKSTNNIGGVANCQNNKPYFTLMRISQFYTWNIELLNSYLNDLEMAKANNYNLVTIKYAFMEADYDIYHYNMIKDQLPKISEKRRLLQEEIISLQLEHKLKYESISRKNSDLMRVNYTSLDEVNNVSYETYLRGELSSYSENTVYLYAKNLVSLENDGINIVEYTINYTYLFKCDEEY